MLLSSRKVEIYVVWKTWKLLKVVYKLFNVFQHKNDSPK